MVIIYWVIDIKLKLKYKLIIFTLVWLITHFGERDVPVVRAFTHGAIGHQIDP